MRLEAAEMFAQDADMRQIARLLRVSAKSVYRWRRAWRAGGEAALASKDLAGSVCKLDGDQLARLGAALDADPAACGWDQDQRWTLARVAALIARLFRVSYTLRGVSYLLHRLGFTPQVAAHRAAERARADLSTRAERPASVQGHRRRCRAAGPGTRPPHLIISTKGGQVVTIPLAPAPPGRSTWPAASAPAVPSS